MLDDLRIEHGRLDQPIPVAQGTLRVELNHVDTSVLPAGVRGTDGDSRILAVAANLAADGSTSCWCPRTCRCGSRPPRSG
jgi:PhoH-like ATPase